MILQSLYPVYWTPVDQTNILYPSVPNLYGGFCGASHKALSSFTFKNSQEHTFSVKTIISFFYYINIQVVNKDQSHPTGPHWLLSPIIMIMIKNLNPQFIQQSFGHASRQRIIKMAKLGVYTWLPKSIHKISHTYHACIISKGTRLPRHTNVSTENLDPGTRFHLEFSFFNKSSFQKFTSTLTIVDATSNHLFEVLTR